MKIVLNKNIEDPWVHIQLQLHLVRLYAAGFNLTVESECVFKTSSNWVLHLSSCIWEELVALDGVSRSVSRFCNSKNELKSGFPAPKCGPQNGPVSEPSAIVPILEGSRNGPGFRAHFLVPLFTLSERRFSQKMVAAGVAVSDHNLSQFLSCLILSRFTFLCPRRQGCLQPAQGIKCSTMLWVAGGR